jgi:ATP-dependent RNA helicase RhlB
MRISGLERNTRARSSRGGRGPARKERFSGDSRGSGHESTGRRSSGSGSRETGRKQNAGRKNGSPTGSPEKTGKRRERQAPLHAASASQSDSRVDRSDVRPDIRAAKQGDLESRLEYYRQKYGEDFQLKESTEKNVSGDVSLGKKKSPTKKSRPAEGGFLKRFFHRGD